MKIIQITEAEFEKKSKRISAENDFIKQIKESHGDSIAVLMHQVMLDMAFKELQDELFNSVESTTFEG